MISSPRLLFVASLAILKLGQSGLPNPIGPSNLKSDDDTGYQLNKDSNSDDEFGSHLENLFNLDDNLD